MGFGVKEGQVSLSHLGILEQGPEGSEGALSLCCAYRGKDTQTVQCEQRS